MLMVFTMLGAGFFLVLSLMIALWVVYLFKRNAGIVDIGWAFSFILCTAAYFAIGNGDFWKKLILAFMVVVWAGRLGWHLYCRFMRNEEEPRYCDIRKKWGGDPSNFLFLMMFILQGVIVIILSLPFLIVNLNGLPGLTSMEVIGFLLWFIGVGGEALADSQMASFHEHPENTGKICRNGLWYYSRHPNYFFEFIVWVGFFIFALSTPLGWISVIAPALMLGLLLKGSGIPLNEAEALRTKGDLYREYQRTTSAFIPWFPKN